MYRYDPGREVDAAVWGTLDESEQIAAVERAHRKVRGTAGSPRLHAALHVIVENQILLGAETPVAAAMQRLRLEGLDRHEAIHAVASVLAVHLREVVARTREDNTAYFREIEALTVATWRASAKGP